MDLSMWDRVAKVAYNGKVSSHTDHIGVIETTLGHVVVQTTHARRMLALIDERDELRRYVHGR